MAEFGKVIVRLHHGWEDDTLVSYDGPTLNEHKIPEGAATFEFDVPDKYEWIHSTSICDDWCFEVCCEYTNSTGSRKETRQLVPQKCDVAS
jgi:hypothetical protein